MPYIVAGYPVAVTSLQVALAAIDAGRTSSRSACRTAIPSPMARRSSARHTSRSVPARPWTPASADRGDRGRPPATPVVPDGLRKPVPRRRRWRGAARRLSDAGASGVIVADLTPDEGGPFEAVARAPDSRSSTSSPPTTPPARRAAIAARRGGFLYCVSLVGVTGARVSLPASVGRLVRDVRAVSPVPVAVGFGVSRPATFARSSGPGRGRDRRIGARRFARSGRTRRRCDVRLVGDLRRATGTSARLSRCTLPR